MRLLKLSLFGALLAIVSACVTVAPGATQPSSVPASGSGLPSPAATTVPPTAGPTSPAGATQAPGTPAASVSPAESPTEAPPATAVVTPAPSETPKPTRTPRPTPEATPKPLRVDLAIYVNTPDLPTEWHVNTDYTIPINVTAAINEVPGVNVKVSIPEEGFATTYITGSIADGGTDTHNVTINVPAMGPATLTLVVKVPLGFADVNTGNNKVTIAIQVLP